MTTAGGAAEQPGAMGDDVLRLREALASHLRSRWGEPGLDIDALEPFGDGHSGLTYAVTLTGSARSGRHVLRAAPPEMRPRGPADIGRQARVMDAVRSHGVPAPEVLAATVDDASLIDGRSFALLGLVQGHSWEEHVERHGHRAVAVAAVDVLRAMRSVPVEGSGLFGEAPFSPLGEIDRWLALLKRCPADLVPLAEQLARRLVGKVPPGNPVGLVHGDLHYGNLIFADDVVAAVVDWEISSLGDPLFDLGALAVASMRSAYAPEPNPTGSVDISLDELADLYDEQPAAVRWFVAASCLKYGIILGYNLELHRSGRRDDPLYESLVVTMRGLLRDGRSVLEPRLDDAPVGLPR